MLVIEPSSDSLSNKQFEKVKNILDKSGVILFPTETVYGLMCRYGDHKAKTKIFTLKKRSEKKPLQCLIANFDSLGKFPVKLSSQSKAIAKNFFPGALTLVVESSCGKNTFGFRCPKFHLLQNLLERLPYPLWATSANISNESDQLNLEQILDTLPADIDLAVKNDDFLSQASTVVKVINNQFTILREGAISKKQIREVFEKCPN